MQYNTCNEGIPPMIVNNFMTTHLSCVYLLSITKDVSLLARLNIWSTIDSEDSEDKFVPMAVYIHLNSLNSLTVIEFQQSYTLFFLSIVHYYLTTSAQKMVFLKTVKTLFDKLIEVYHWNLITRHWCTRAPIKIALSKVRSYYII